VAVAEPYPRAPRSSRRSIAGSTSTPRFLIVSVPIPRARTAALSAFVRCGSSSRIR